ncbi:hypothetical protein LCGC14_3017780, partial [marine sediment metagenome]
RAEDELKHQGKLEEITLQGRQRIEIEKFKLQSQGVQNEALVVDWQERIRNFDSSLKDIPDKKLRETVQLSLPGTGIKDFSQQQVKAIKAYRTGTGAINQIFSDFDEFTELSFGVSRDSLDRLEKEVLTTSKEDFQERISRLFQGGKGFIEGIIPFTRRGEFIKRFEIGLVAVNEATGGERGGRQSNIDMERARLNLPALSDILYDYLNKRSRFRNVFMDQFNVIFGDASLEQQEEQLSKMNLPFGLSLRSQEKIKGKSSFSRADFIKNDPGAQKFKFTEEELFGNP